MIPERFKEDTPASYTVVAAATVTSLERRRAAEEQAYNRWEQELVRKYRSKEGEPVGAGDELWAETVATREDFARLRELVGEELARRGVT